MRPERMALARVRLINGDGALRALLRDLEAAWSPATCPHGRPAFVLLTAGAAAGVLRT